VRRAVLSLLAIFLAVALLAGHGGVDPRSAAIVETGVAAAFALVAVVAWQRGTMPLPHPAALVAAGALAFYALLALASEDWSMSPLASRQDALRATSYALAVLTGAALASFGERTAALGADADRRARRRRVRVGDRGARRSPTHVRPHRPPAGHPRERQQPRDGGRHRRDRGLALARRSPRPGSRPRRSALHRVRDLVARRRRGRHRGRRRPRPGHRRPAAPAARTGRVLLPALALGLWVSTFGVFDAVAGPVDPAGARLLVLGLLAMAAGPVALRLADAVAARVPAARRTIAERGLVGAGAAAFLVLVVAIARRTSAARRHHRPRPPVLVQLQLPYPLVAACARHVPGRPLARHRRRHVPDRRDARTRTRPTPPCPRTIALVAALQGTGSSAASPS
jgi:hypothetical protein